LLFLYTLANFKTQYYEEQLLRFYLFRFLLRHHASGCRWRRLKGEGYLFTQNARPSVSRFCVLGDMNMAFRGIRGAITISTDNQESVVSVTRELLEAILLANPSLEAKDIGSAIFTVTDDIRSAFPAQAARLLGWDKVPLLCTREIPVPHSLPLCIRVLIQWNTDLPQEAVRHVYLHEAQSLRPDLAGVNP
jgi:chorismate mutase